MGQNAGFLVGGAGMGWLGGRVRLGREGVNDLLPNY